MLTGDDYVTVPATDAAKQAAAIAAATFSPFGAAGILASPDVVLLMDEEEIEVTLEAPGAPSSKVKKAAKPQNQAFTPSNPTTVQGAANTMKMAAKRQGTGLAVVLGIAAAAGVGWWLIRRKK